MSEKPADWTTGAEAIVYQSCAACSSLQYFRRSFCVACGGQGQPCCQTSQNSSCGAPYTCSQNTCVHCGAPQEPCCQGRFCGSGSCSGQGLCP